MASGPTIIAKFIADTSKMESDVASAGSKMESTFGSSAKKLGLALGGAFVAKEVFEFGKASVEAAAADAEAQQKLANTLKNVTGATDDQVASNEKFLGSLSKATAIADDDLRPAMDSLVRGFGDTEDAQKALALATDISAGTGKDLQSVSEALMKAANGQTAGLRKLGIETKNADGSAKSLDEIMGDLSKTFKGQAADSAKSTAGQMRAAEIAMGEFQETIGTKVMPIIAKLAIIFTETLLPALEKTFGWLVDHKDLVLAALIAIGVVLVPMFLSWAAGALAAAAATIIAFAPFIGIGAVIAGVAFLIIHNWDTIKAAAQTVWDLIMSVFHWVADNWPLLLTILTGPFGAAVWIIKEHWDKIKGAALAVWNWLTGTWQTITDWITGPIEAAVGIVTTAWDTITGAPKKAYDWLNSTWQGISAIITKPITLAKGIIVTLWHSIEDAATGAYNWIKGKFDAIAGAIEAVLGGIKTAVGKIVSAITDPINAVIRGWNNLSFTLPTIRIGKVEVLGKTIFPGVTLGGQTFSTPNIPELAGGGVLTAPTLFIGGEAGREIVSPEALLRQIVREEGGGNYTLNIYPRQVDVADMAYGFRRLELLAGVA
jgi:hypothetical protein